MTHVHELSVRHLSKHASRNGGRVTTDSIYKHSETNLVNTELKVTTSFARNTCLALQSRHGPHLQ